MRLSYLIVIVEKDLVGKATVSLKDSQTRANWEGGDHTDVTRNADVIVGVKVPGGLLV